MNEAFYSAFAREWIESWNAHDLGRILAHYGEEVEFYSPFVSKLTGDPHGVIHGKAALGRYFARGLQAYPELCFKLIRVYAGVSGCVLEYHSVNGLLAAEVMEFNADHQVQRVLAHYTSSTM